MDHGLTEKNLLSRRSREINIFFLGALSLFLAAIEMLIPKPLPFLKLGLATMPTLLFIRVLPLHKLLSLGIIKVVGQGIIAANLLSYIGVFSLGSTMSSILAMWLISRFPATWISLLGISVVGAIASNLMQLLLALLWFFPEMGHILLPWSLGFGSLSGLIMGSFALSFARRSRWYQLLLCCR